jgi:hypothetical protein
MTIYKTIWRLLTKKIKISFKLPLWLYSEIIFIVDNHWKRFWSGQDYFCIWIGTEFTRGDEYRRILNVYTFELTIFNIGFKIRFRGNPEVSFEFHEYKKCKDKK